LKGFLSDGTWNYGVHYQTQNEAALFHCRFINCQNITAAAVFDISIYPSIKIFPIFRGDSDLQIIKQISGRGLERGPGHERHNRMNASLPLFLPLLLLILLLLFLLSVKKDTKRVGSTGWAVYHMVTRKRCPTR